MYKIKKLIDEGLSLLKLNETIIDNIEKIKYLSNNFNVENTQALRLDELLEIKIKRDFKEALPVKLKVISRNIEEE